MEPFWELTVFAWIIAALLTLVVLSVAKAYWSRERRWRAVAPYYGRPYDASTSTTHRQNIRLVRP